VHLGRWDGYGAWLSGIRRSKQTPLDLSIAKAQVLLWRVFEVKYFYYILFGSALP